MSTSATMVPAPASRSPTEWTHAIVGNLVGLQALQLDMFIAWQRACSTLQQELWDEWTCRFAGGVPIDA